jgi:hypothetical protein
VTSEDTPQGPRPVEAVVEIIFQKPYQQRIVATSEVKTATATEQRLEITALDNYDGWHRVQDAKDPSRWRMDLLNKDQIKRLRANTWENLAFYRGLERRGGTIEDLGEANVGGTACYKLAFKHELGIVFIRYFDQATGRLVLTETEQGGSIREEGEIMADGIRFPRRIITTTKQADGKERSVTVNFDKVTVNETFASTLFVVLHPLKSWGALSVPRRLGHRNGKGKISRPVSHGETESQGSGSNHPLLGLASDFLL